MITSLISNDVTVDTQDQWAIKISLITAEQTHLWSRSNEKWKDAILCSFWPPHHFDVLESAW